jgi:hypothetical protein
MCSLDISANNWLKQRKKQYFFLGANDCSEDIRDAWKEKDSSSSLKRRDENNTEKRDAIRNCNQNSEICELIFPPQAGYGLRCPMMIPELGSIKISTRFVRSVSGHERTNLEAAKCRRR